MLCTQLDWKNWAARVFGKKTLARRPAIKSVTTALETLEDRALLSGSSIMAQGRWIINADVDPNEPSETIVVQQDLVSENRIQVVINGEILDSRLSKRVRSITINAGNGDDVVTINLPPELARIITTINGGNGNDTLNAGTNRAILRGGAGDDVLNGSNGNDVLFGGDGDDILNGNGGNDVLKGDGGVDSLMGGKGADQIQGGQGKDWIFSSIGDDDVDSDSDDVVTAEKSVGVQQFQTNDEFIEWLKHTDAVSQRMGYGSIYTATSGPLQNVVSTGAPAAADDTSHSDTNTQVADVDEQDIIETDGDYVYIIHGQELQIVDVRDASNPTVVSRSELPGWGAEMYLDGDRLTVVTNINRFFYPLDDTPPGFASPDFMIARPIWGGRPQTEVTTYDISDRTTPKVVEDTTLDGTVQTSRSVDGRIYLIVNNSPWTIYPWLDYFPPVMTASGADASTASFAPSIPVGTGPIDWSNFIPHYTTRSYDADGNLVTRTGSLLDAPNIWATENGIHDSNLMSVVMFDIHAGDAGVDESSSVYGLSGQIYASDDAIYVAATDWYTPILTPVSSVSAAAILAQPSTEIYKFDLSTEGSKLVATGRVDGTIIDEFSMDEHDGYFRIATTTSSTWGNSNLSSNIFVLQQQGDDLVTVSSLTGLSPGERIQSVRFVDDHAYLSTFLRIDPLLAVDLTDPLHPVLTGSLEVPGFSTYLQQWGDHYLISIGQDADASTGMVTGLQLSMFDTSGDTPVLVGTYRLSVSAWDTYSQAQWDHHAFSLFDEQGILAIPVSHWTSNTDHGTQLDVFQLDGTTGFTLLGTVDHDSEVLRSLRIGDELVSLSNNELKINDLTQPGTELGEVNLDVMVDPPPPIPFPFPIKPTPVSSIHPIDPPIVPVHPIQPLPKPPKPTPVGHRHNNGHKPTTHS